MTAITPVNDRGRHFGDACALADAVARWTALWAEYEAAYTLSPATPSP